MAEPRMGTFRPTMTKNVLLAKSELGKVGRSEKLRCCIGANAAAHAPEHSPRSLYCFAPLCHTDPCVCLRVDGRSSRAHSTTRRTTGSLVLPTLGTLRAPVMVRVHYWGASVSLPQHPLHAPGNLLLLRMAAKLSGSPDLRRVVTMVWKQHEANPDDKPGPDFTRMNKTAAMGYGRLLAQLLYNAVQRSETWILKPSCCVMDAAA